MALMRTSTEPKPVPPASARVVKSQRFAELMALYEGNYERLRKLCPPVRHLSRACQSRLAGSPALWIQPISQERHTSVLLLTHRFEHDAQPPEPAAFVRVYHDTRQAEVTHFRIGSGLRALFASDLPPSEAGQRRLRNNRFFAKWLDFLENCGHSPHTFEVASRDLQLSGGHDQSLLTGEHPADIICGSRVGL